MQMQTFGLRFFFMCLFPCKRRMESSEGKSDGTHFKSVNCRPLQKILSDIYAPGNICKIKFDKCSLSFALPPFLHSYFCH